MISTTEGERTLYQIIFRWHDYRARTPLHRLGNYIEDPISVLMDFLNSIFVGDPDALLNKARKEKALRQLGTLAVRTWYHRWQGKFVVLIICCGTRKKRIQ